MPDNLSQRRGTMGPLFVLEARLVGPGRLISRSGPRRIQKKVVDTLPTTCYSSSITSRPTSAEGSEARTFTTEEQQWQPKNGIPVQPPRRRSQAKREINQFKHGEFNTMSKYKRPVGYHEFCIAYDTSDATKDWSVEDREDFDLYCERQAMPFEDMFDLVEEIERYIEQLVEDYREYVKAESELDDAEMMATIQ